MTGHVSRVIAMLAVSGALLGFSASMFIPRRYVAEADLAISPTPGVTHESYLSDARRLCDSATELTLIPASLELAIRRSSYFRERLYVDKLTDVQEDVRRNLSITSQTFSGGRIGARIEFEDDDADTALDFTKGILSQLGENAARVAGAKKAADVVTILRIPQTRLAGVTPLMLSGLGAAAGLLLGFLLAVFAPKNTLTR